MFPGKWSPLKSGQEPGCTYCPGSSMGADDLLANGKLVAIVENHNGDAYANSYSNARNTIWAIPGYPTATFDGNLSVVGGSHTVSSYSSYLPKYLASIGVTSPVAMTMEVEHTDDVYTATIEMTKVGTISATNIVLYFFVTQSHIQYNWQGQSHLNFVNIQMVPNQNGTTVSFAGGDVQTVELIFTIDPSLPLEDGEFVAMLQNRTSGQGVIPGPYPVNKWEVYQTIKEGVVALTVDFEASATQVEKNTPVTFSNNTTGGYIGVPETYKWFFPGAEPDYTTEENPTVTYTQVGTFDVTFIVDRGGQIDTIVKTDHIQVVPSVGIDEQPETIIASVYPNPSNGQFFVELYTLKPAVVNIEIVNTRGAVVYQERNVSVDEKLARNLDLNLNSGIYYLIVNEGESKKIRKLVIL